MGMAVSLLHHRVADFDAWKQVYDGFRDAQREGGVRYQSVLRSTDDPNLVVVTHSFDSKEAAQAYFDNQELKAAMERGGVDVSSLSIEFLDEVQSGTL
jgi:heme-degrading monooxygenase HmoA